MAAGEEPIRHLLLDPEYWKPRLEQLSASTPQLIRIPRTDLSRPGIEVVELRLRAHDGVRIRALLARSAFHRSGRVVHLRTCVDLTTCAIDFGAVEKGASDLVFPYPNGRRLEDRVLDVLQLARTVCTVESVECRAVTFHCGHQPQPDEFRLAELMREEGWV